MYSPFSSAKYISSYGFFHCRELHFNLDKIWIISKSLFALLVWTWSVVNFAPLKFNEVFFFLDHSEVWNISQSTRSPRSAAEQATSKRNQRQLCSHTRRVSKMNRKDSWTTILVIMPTTTQEQSLFDQNLQSLTNVSRILTMQENKWEST